MAKMVFNGFARVGYGMVYNLLMYGLNKHVSLSSQLASCDLNCGVCIFESATTHRIVVAFTS
jgi:hypothetical protein